MSKKYSKKKSKLQNRTRSKIRQRIYNKNHYGGSTRVGLNISYNNGNIIINNGQTSNDFTEHYNNQKLNLAPEINIINGLENTKYLVLLYDPDAPNGISGIGNHIYTHWIFTQTGIDNKYRNVILPYKQPNPPHGKHRYIFKIYNALNISNETIENLIKSNEQSKLPNATNLLEYQMQFTIDSKK
jgi:phosphatidylethanolamine-binding protein (PEBP) family uncharacterized protein